MRETLLKIVTRRVIYTSMLAAIIASAYYGGYRYYLLNTVYESSQDSNATLIYGFGVLNEKLKAANALNDDLKRLLQIRQQEKDEIGERVQSLSTTISTLDKLANTDKELLEKYSSVYFLNENYTPKNLVSVDAAYLTLPDRPELITEGILHHLTELLRAADADKVPLQVLSAYRSYGAQSMLKSKYSILYGTGSANSFSADQGYSEHQLGTAVDFTTPSIGASLAGLDKTPEFEWLTSHAFLYGFILSYPKDNSHFVFEPWHWRYVGVELATKLHNEHKALYEMDQREIDTYLLKFFD
jgi:LAS superfamily LD-carboxypeptidase LdcB